VIEKKLSQGAWGRSPEFGVVPDAENRSAELRRVHYGTVARQGTTKVRFVFVGKSSATIMVNRWMFHSQALASV
jgi:hypothetical protein